jgi:hypothetical protein
MAPPAAQGGGASAPSRNGILRSIAQTCRAPSLIIETLTGRVTFIVIAPVPPITEAALSFGAG